MGGDDMRLVYFENATGNVRSITPDKFGHLEQAEREAAEQADADERYGAGVCSVSRVENSDVPALMSTWDPATKTTTAPPPAPPSKPDHPAKARVEAIRARWSGDYSKATVAELAEILDAGGMLDRIVGT